MARRRIRYTSKTLEYLRDNGFSPWITERTIGRAGMPFAGKQDLYNIIDAVALVPGQKGERRVYGIQSTSKGALRQHILKYEEKDLKRVIRLWLDRAGPFYIVAWHKKNNRWKPLLTQYMLVKSGNKTFVGHKVVSEIQR